MSRINNVNSLKISDFNRVAQSDEALNLSKEGRVVAKSSFGQKLLALIKPEKTRRDNQQTTATFVASITRTLNAGAESGIFSRLEGISPDQKEAILSKILNYKDVSGKGILDDQLSGAKPLTGRKASQVIKLVNQEVSKIASAIELNALKETVDNQIEAGNDFLPQADRLRFGKLKLGEEAKTIEGGITKLIHEITGNVSKLKKEVEHLQKQLKNSSGQEAEALGEQIADLKTYIKGGEDTIRDLKPIFNRHGKEPVRSEDTHIQTTSLNYLSKKEPLPAGAAIKSALHKEARADKGDSRSFDSTGKTQRVQIADQINIGIVPGVQDEVEQDARLGEDSPKSTEKKAEAELREALSDLPNSEVEDIVKQAKFKSDEVEDLDPNVLKAERKAAQDKLAQLNEQWGIKSDKA
jgi:hypothetical protein